MALLLQTPLQLTGADFSGTSGDTNRTYTFGDTRVVQAGMQVLKQGMALQFTGQVSLSGAVLTIAPVLFDGDAVYINWYIDSSISTAGGDTEYATPLELNKFMGLVGDVIDREASTVTYFENIGTGDNSATLFALSKEGWIADTLTLYYDDTEANAIANQQTLTLSTHYTIDEDTGVITLTAAGVTALGTDSIFADYKYNVVGIVNSEVQNALNRAGKLFENLTNNKWTDGTQATPNYVKVSNELHRGRGIYNRDYFSFFRPVADITTNTDGSTSSGATTITVDSTNGFPSTGTVEIDGQKISYTGKTSTTFTGVTGVSATIADGTQVNSMVFEYSMTPSGTTPTYTVAKRDSEYALYDESGRFHLHLGISDSDTTTYLVNHLAPSYRVPDRVRLSYLQGNTSIPEDVKYGVLALASKDLMKSAVRKAHTEGKNDFEPSLIAVDEDELKRIIKEHTNSTMGRTI